MQRISNIFIRNIDLVRRAYVTTAILTIVPPVFAEKSASSTVIKKSNLPKFSTTGSTLSFRGKMGGVQTVETDLPESNTVNRPDKVKLTEEEWKAKLSSKQFQVCRRKGTEPAWTGDFLDNKEKGVYYCSACGVDLFSSSSKFDSGSGWPSFFDVIRDKTTNIPNVEIHVDKSHGMERTEVLCGRCDSHLGHVFNDGPEPSGLRFCINSVSLKFRKQERDEL